MKDKKTPKFKKKEYEVKLLSDQAFLPKKAVRGSIGYDLCVPRDFHVPAHSRVAIPLDLAINLPAGIEGKIEPRSGCSLRGIEGYGTRTVITGKILGIFPKKKVESGKMYFDADVCVGKVDPNYTDNIHVIVINRDESFLIRKGSRIAQLTFYQTIAPFFKKVEELTCKSRGGGLGHTGIDRITGRNIATENNKPTARTSYEEADTSNVGKQADQQPPIADTEDELPDTSKDAPEEIDVTPDTSHKENDDENYGVHV